MQLACPNCGTRDARVSHRQGLSERESRRLFGTYPLRCAAVQDTLEDERLGFRSLEVCTLSPLLQARTHHVERAVLPSSAVDQNPASLRRHTLPLFALPMQFL